MKFWKALVLCILVLALGGCSLFDKEDEPSPAPDSEGEQAEVEDSEYPVYAGGAELPGRPGRVVSLAPALTEKLYDLGMADRLEGVSDYCDYPGAVQDLPRCGTAQMPDLEAIEQLAPHLVLTEGALPEDAMAALEAQGIPVATLPHAASVDELMTTYTDLARLMEGETAGRVIGGSIVEDYRGYLAYLEDICGEMTQEGVKAGLYLQLLDFTVATGDTLENELLDAIYVRNIAADRSGWEYPAEAAAGAEGRAAFQEVGIIFMDEKFVTIKDLEQSEFYKGLPATINDRYFYIDSTLMERQSLRSLDLLADMAEAAYPGVSADYFATWSGNYEYADPGEDPPEGDVEDELEEGDDMLAALDDMP